MKDERKEKVLSELRNSITEQINLFNKALNESDFSKMARAEAALKELETEYAETMATIVYDEVGDKENPIKAAIIKYWYPTLSHKNIREDGKLVRFELEENKMRQIDLIKLAKYCGIDSKWQYAIEKFNQLMTLRAARELKLSSTEVKKICDSFYMSKLSREVDLGGTPDSNTQICKQLQTIVDAMVFEDDGKGKNKYKVNNHDVAYLLMCYTKKNNKTALTVSVAKTAVVNRLIMDIEHRVILGKAYGLDYKIAKDTEKTESKKADEAKKEPEKAENVKAESKKTAKKATKKADEKVTEVEKKSA